MQFVSPCAALASSGAEAEGPRLGGVRVVAPRGQHVVDRVPREGRDGGGVPRRGRALGNRAVVVRLLRVLRVRVDDRLDPPAQVLDRGEGAKVRNLKSRY